MQVYFDTDYAVIAYDEGCGVLTGSAKTQLLSLELREYMYAFLSAMLYFKATKALIDTEKINALQPLDKKWISAKWLNKVMKGEHPYAAIMLPNGIYPQMTLEATMTETVSEMVFSHFNNTEEAIAWLTSSK